MTDEILDVMMGFPVYGESQSMLVKQIGPNQFCIEDPLAILVLAEVVQYKDIVEVEPKSPRRLVFKRIVEPSQWTSHVFMISRELPESDKLGALVEHVKDLGGVCDGVFGGVLVVCLPPDSDFDIKSAIKNL